MRELYYIGLDVHKKTITYCSKTQDGALVARGTIEATRAALSAWAQTIEHPWSGRWKRRCSAAGFTITSAFARELHVAHPAMLKAIACAKKKNDRLDAEKVCDLLRLRPAAALLSGAASDA